jgi:large subunit ribosomal protein L4
MRSILSSLAKENRIFLADQINIENPKTKDFIDFLNKNDLNEGLFIVDEVSENLNLASRNIPNINVTNFKSLNPVNLLRFNSIVISESCINLIEKELS